MNMKRFFIIFTILLSSICVFAQHRADKDAKSGKWGFRSENGAWAIQPKFDEYDVVNTFSKAKNFAVVRIGKLWGCVTTDGSYVCKMQFRTKQEAVKAGNEWHAHVAKGKTLYTNFDLPNQKFGFADYAGGWIINPLFTDVSTTYNFYTGKNIAVVKEDECWGAVSKNGLYVIKPVLISEEDAKKAATELEAFATLGQNIYEAYDIQTKKWGFANYKGNWVVKPILDFVDHEYVFQNGRSFAVVKYKGKWGCINRLGSFIIKPTYAEKQAAKNAGFAWQNTNKESIKPAQLPNFDDGKHKESMLASSQGSGSNYHTDNAQKNQQNQTRNFGMPPSMRIILPKDGADYTSSEVTFTYEAKTADGSAPEILAYINGEPQPRTKGIKRVGSQITLSLPRVEDCRVQLIAKDKNGQNSDPAVVLLHYRGNRPKPNLRVLAVGVSDYDQKDLKLQHAAKDATDFANVVSKMHTSMYTIKTPQVILDKNATDKNIKKGLSSLVGQVEQGDVVMLFFSGHGSKEGGETYFLSSNAESNDLFSSAVNFDEIRSAVKRLKDRKCRVLIFMDACHSGALYGQKSVAESYALSEPGVIGFYSSTETQKSNESEQWNNGIFTKALIEGLRGQAKDKDGNITIDELERYIRESVRKATKGKQMPIFENKQGNFILFEASN